MERERARIGRPLRKAARGEKRASLGLKVRIEVKKRIDEAARASGRTQSQEAEFLIERALAYEAAIEAARTTAPRLVESALRRLGYTPLHTPHGDAWLPPGHPGGSRGGFIDPEGTEK